MFLAVLEFFDFLMIGVLIVLFSGGTAIASRRSASSAAAGERLSRIEDKLNLLLEEKGIYYVPSARERWQRLAELSDTEGAAKDYSETYSVSAEEAEEVVAQYLADIKRPI